MEVAFNYNKLKGRMIEKYGNQTTFAKAFGTSENSLSRKMNNKMRFTSDDIIRVTELLDIPESQIGEYFFTLKV